MLPNTQFTGIFMASANSFGDFTNAVVIGNFMMNLFLSGAMTFLWGLLNNAQIVAHYPLVNVMMPANAEFVFQILV